MMSMHINESQDTSIPASSAMISSLRSVLFARRFIHITLTTKSVTTVAGMLLRSIAVFSLSPLSHSLNFDIFCSVTFVRSGTDGIGYISSTFKRLVFPDFPVVSPPVMIILSPFSSERVVFAIFFAV